MPAKIAYSPSLQELIDAAQAQGCDCRSAERVTYLIRGGVIWPLPNLQKHQLIAHSIAQNACRVLSLEGLDETPPNDPGGPGALWF